MKHKTKQTYIIVSDDGFWNNEFGWGDYKKYATKFKNTNYNLPIGRNVKWFRYDDYVGVRIFKSPSDIMIDY